MHHALFLQHEFLQTRFLGHFPVIRHINMPIQIAIHHIIHPKIIKGTYAEPFTECPEDNAETVESKDTVFAIRV